MRHFRNSTLFAFGVFLFAASLLPACGKKSIRSEQIEPTPGVTASATVSPSESTTPTAAAREDSLFSVAENAVSASPTVTYTPTVSDYAYVPETVSMEQDADIINAKTKKSPSSTQKIKSSGVSDTEMEQGADVIEAGLKKTPRAAQTPKVSRKPTATPQPTATPIPTPPSTSAVLGSVKGEPMSSEPLTGGKSSWKMWGWLLVVLLVLGALWYYWRKSQEDDSTPTHPSAPLGGLSPVSGFFAKRAKKSPPSAKTNKKD